MPGQIAFSKKTTPMLLRAIRSFLAATEGAAAVEFSLFAPMLVGMIICTMDFGVAVYRKMQVQHAAQAGVQYAIANGYDSSGITSAVTNATTYAGISASPAPNQFCGCRSTTGVTAADSCTSICGDGAVPGTYVTVSAQATYTTIVPYHAVIPAIANSYTLTGQGTVRIQ